MKTVYKNKKLLIGVIHLPALPGYEDFRGLDYIVKKGITDLQTLEKAGFDGALIENDGDHPPFLGFNKRITETFSLVFKQLKDMAHIPLGMEILYDMEGTYRTAARLEADFVRLDVFVDDVQTAYGPVYAPAQYILQMRERGLVVPIFADVQVKHTKMFDENKTLMQSTKEAILFGAESVIVTGTWTGKEPSIYDCIEVKSAAENVPVLIGSGITQENVAYLLRVAKGAIVGTSIKDGEYISLEKAKALKKKVELLD